jgi:oligopeptide/dipeptide ABC transporter ATP-binding protein
VLARDDRRRRKASTVSDRAPIVALDGVSKLHRRGGLGLRRSIRAVDGVSLRIARSEALALVGETGAGRSTLGRLSLALERPSAGDIRFEDVDLVQADQHTLTLLRRHAQLIDGDPRRRLDPALSVAATLAEPLLIHERLSRAEREQRVEGLLKLVGLEPGLAAARPAALSIGQCQRVVLARAVAIQPRYLVLDEATAQLDPPVQAQILDLVARLRKRFDLALMLITSDLRIARHLCDRIAVMHLGRIVEQGPAVAICDAPRHPFTRALVAAVAEPSPGGSAMALVHGEPPDPTRPLSGCSFRTRCPQAGPRCVDETPRRVGAGDDDVACHLHDGGVAAGV